MTITVLLADDHRLILEGLQLLLDKEPDLRVVGQVTDGRELVRQTLARQPDVVIVDITMPELNGIEAVRQIQAVSPHCQAIILSMHGTAEHVQRALEAGARGYLVKGSAVDEVVEAVRAVAHNKYFFSLKVAALVDPDKLLHPRHAIPTDPLARLSPREREVLQLVVEGNSNAKIAAKLHLSPKSISTYRGRIMSKLNMPDLPSLIKFALQHDLTPPS